MLSLNSSNSYCIESCFRLCAHCWKCSRGTRSSLQTFSMKNQVLSGHVCVCVFVHVYTLDYVWVWMNLCMCVRERRSAMIITDSFLHIFVVAYHPREWRCLLCEWSCRIAGSIQAKLRFYCMILSKCSPVNILANLKCMHRYGSVPS